MDDNLENWNEWLIMSSSIPRRLRCQHSSKNITPYRRMSDNAEAGSSMNCEWLVHYPLFLGGGGCCYRDCHLLDMCCSDSTIVLCEFPMSILPRRAPCWASKLSKICQSRSILMIWYIHLQYVMMMIYIPLTKSQETLLLFDGLKLVHFSSNLSHLHLWLMHHHICRSHHLVQQLDNSSCEWCWLKYPAAK